MSETDKLVESEKLKKRAGELFKVTCFETRCPRFDSPC